MGKFSTGFAMLLLLAASAAGGSWNNAEPVPANLPLQRIGPNDLIAISVYGAPELSRTVRVAPDGTIRLPMVKQKIKAQSLLPTELEVVIAQVLEHEQLLVEPVVTVTVAEYQSRPISVAGAVRNPITFQASGPVTLLEAITRAGGLTQEAGDEILITRKQINEAGQVEALVERVSVKSLIDGADSTANVELRGGEEIRVPEAGKIFVIGTVRKPGAYALPDGAATTVLQVLALAEGLAPFAAKQAYIYRPDPSTGMRNEIRIELAKILNRKAPDVPLQARDILYVPDSSGRRLTVSALEKIAAFGTATASGILIWRR